MHAALTHCLQAASAVPECRDVAEWWPRWQQGPSRAGSTGAMAMLGGFAADRVGWAFACGYQAALRALWPQLPADALAAFCVTEEAGNRPRDLRTRITPLGDGTGSISGAKRWTTLGPASSLLLIVGALPAPDDAAQPRLKVACVPAHAPGLQLQHMPPTRFVPEVPHARVVLDAVRVQANALLPGDGYTAYVKPFRTLEDAHVSLAVLAYLLREARQRSWPATFAERCCAAMLVLAELAAARADAPATHIALTGALHITQGLYAEAGTLWAATPEDPAAQRWVRDAALFAVAGSARGLRAQRAWQNLQRVVPA